MVDNQYVDDADHAVRGWCGRCAGVWFILTGAGCRVQDSANV